MPGTNEIYDEHELELEDLPPELQPIPEVDWSDLSSTAVQRIVDRLPEAMLEEVPGDDRLLCGVLATGVGLRHDGAIMPTVAGLVAFGLHPELVLPGMQLRVSVNGGEAEAWSGPLPTLIRHASEHAVLGERLGEASCGLLVAHAMAWRSWEDAHLDAPISMGIEGDVLALRYPGVSGTKVTNRVIADLLCRSGWTPKRSAGLGPVKRALRGIGAKIVGVDAEEEWTVVRIRLAAAEPSSREPMERIARPVLNERAASTPESRAPAPRRGSERAGAGVDSAPPGTRRSAEDRLEELVQILTVRGRMSRRGSETLALIDVKPEAVMRRRAQALVHSSKLAPRRVHVEAPSLKQCERFVVEGVCERRGLVRRLAVGSLTAWTHEEAHIVECRREEPGLGVAVSLGPIPLTGEERRRERRPRCRLRGPPPLGSILYVRSLLEFRLFRGPLIEVVDGPWQPAFQPLRAGSRS